MAMYRQFKDGLKLSGAGRNTPPKPLTPAVLAALEKHVRDSALVSPVALLDTADIAAAMPTPTKEKSKKNTRDDQLERLIDLERRKVEVFESLVNFLKK